MVPFEVHAEVGAEIFQAAIDPHSSGVHHLLFGPHPRRVVCRLINSSSEMENALG